MDGGSFVVYPEVRTMDSANGWTDHIYSYAPDYPSSTFPQTPTEDMSFRRGNLVTENIYDNNGVLLKRKSLGYTERYSSESQIGYKYKPYWYVGAYDATYTDVRLVGPDYSPNLAACEQYGVMGIFWTLRQTIETIFTPAGNLVDSTNYTYANYNDYYYLKNETIVGSNSNIKQRSYKYAFTNTTDFKLGLSTSEQTMKSTLLDKNFFQPLEVVDSMKASGGSFAFLNGSKYIFGKYNNDSLIHLKTFRSYATATDSTELNFSAYDSSGNLREQYKTNDIREVYLWGYNRTYPVAKVTGSDLSTVLGFVHLSVLNSPSSDEALREELDNIRVGLANSKARVITYTYSPLYGMSSMTDASGKIIYYEYDLFGRLKLVRDSNGYIIKKNEYKLNNP
jgi:YD repeat-containing protein